MSDYTKLLSDFPEINPANYGDDEVNALNAWGIAAHTAIEALQAKLGDAIQSSAHWQHQFTEVQAENERLKRELEISKLDTKEWHSQADALQSKLAAMGKWEPVPPEQVEAAWRAGWAACRDAEYVGQEAEDEAWGMSETCANADWESAEEAAHGIGGTP